MRVLSAVSLNIICRAFSGPSFVFSLEVMAGFGASSDPCMVFCMSNMRCYVEM